MENFNLLKFSVVGLMSKLALQHITAYAIQSVKIGTTRGKESGAVVDLIANWRTNNSNLTTANLLQAIAGSKFVPPSSEQNILNSCVSKENLSKIYLLPWRINEEIKLRMFQFKLIHNTVLTKDRLFKASIVQDDKCYFCKENS